MQTYILYKLVKPTGDEMQKKYNRSGVHRFKVRG